MSVFKSKGAVNTTLVVAGAKGIVESLDRTQLVEYGGDITLTTLWAESLLKRMNFTQRRATTKCGIPPHVFRDVKTEFWQSVIDMVEMEEIPSQLILNWDQTGLHLVPASNWTMANKGLKHVEMKGIEDKRQITAFFLWHVMLRISSDPNYLHRQDWQVSSIVLLSLGLEYNSL